MPFENIYRFITIDEQSVTPKYLQITNSIIKAVSAGNIQTNYLLPSINDLSYELEISRDTAERAYRHLKKLGFIGSVPGKGYFIIKTEFDLPLKIFLLFNKLSTHKKIIYDAFAATLGEKATIDFYIYNNDFRLFKKFLENKRDDYTHYIIIPHFVEGGEKAYEIINRIPRGKLLILDKMVTGVEEPVAAVYEDFEHDIYEGLEKALEKLQKYHTIKIVFPTYTYHPKEILQGFHRFCNQYAFECAVINKISAEVIEQGVIYISLMEDDLVVLTEKILDSKLKVGEQVGIISYNETPIKKIILDGITTISTDFAAMGSMAAKLIMEKKSQHFKVPFKLTLRNSL